MTDTGTPSDLASLEPLEPLEGAPMAPMAGEDPMAAQRAGLPAPAFNMYCRDKAFYRFLFAGVVMFVGCCMPFSAEIGRAGYQTMSGGFYLLIAIAMIWTWWASIANNRPTGLKWLLAAMVPLIATGWGLAGFDPVAAHDAARAHGWLTSDVPFSGDFKAMLGDIGSTLAKNEDAPVRVENFWRLFGPGRFFVFLGALIAEVGFVMGVVGGHKQNKAQAKQKQMAAAERRRK